MQNSVYDISTVLIALKELIEEIFHNLYIFEISVNVNVHTSLFNFSSYKADLSKIDARKLLFIIVISFLYSI